MGSELFTEHLYKGSPPAATTRVNHYIPKRINWVLVKDVMGSDIMTAFVVWKS